MRLLQEKPDNMWAILYLSAIKFQQKKPNDAKQCLQKLLALNYTSESSEAYEMASMLMADSHMAEKNYTEAEKVLKNAFLYNKNNGIF